MQVTIKGSADIRPFVLQTVAKFVGKNPDEIRGDLLITSEQFLKLAHVLLFGIGLTILINKFPIAVDDLIKQLEEKYYHNR